ncbi:MAG: glucose-6-phosphate isomerase family protein, partial [Armatimonadota bacterium]
RSLHAIRQVTKDPNADGPAILYRMYRNMGRSDPDSRKLARVRGLRYDISVFDHGTLGDEWFKTSGHYHPPLPGVEDISYPEVYEVMYGTAMFLLQKVDDPRAVMEPGAIPPVTDVILIVVREGERAVMPPNYGHVMINATDDVVVTSNWVSSLFNSQYGPYAAARGAAYYVLKDGDGVALEPNPAYGDVPQCRRGRPRQDLPALGIESKTPLYTSFYYRPELWTYVSRPDLCLDELAPEKVIEFAE